jgi:hypothetical protein
MKSAQKVKYAVLARLHYDRQNAWIQPNIEERKQFKKEILLSAVGFTKKLKTPGPILIYSL